MAELPYQRKATARKLEEQGGTAGLSSVFSLFTPGAEATNICAYNQTRERFLSVDVEAADFSPVILNRRLATLTSGSGSGLCIVPFRGISPTSVRFPVDLVFLNSTGTVLLVVDSFPISQIPSASTPPAGVLVLPAQTVGATGTSRGDQLLLCPSEEMKLRLQQLAETKAQPEPEPVVEETASDSPRSAQKAAGNVLPWVDRPRPTPAPAPVAEVPAVVESAPAPVQSAPAVVETPRIEAPPSIGDVPAPSPVVPPAVSQPTADEVWQKRHKAPKGWLKKLLASEPKDPRRSPREELSWLGAYFFTGGKPVAYGIRDISAVGAYVFTQERWYPGTVLRVTLVDRRRPTEERSFTLNAKVVRPGNDGVGLEFVLNDKQGGRSSMDGQVAGVDRELVELFLDRVRGVSN